MKDYGRWNKLLQLFLTFLKIGAFTFGGGYAMIPLIQKETVENHHWLENKDILDIVAVAESTPGPIAVNAATFVGFHTAGLLGAFLATFGVVLPSFLIILVLSFFLKQFQNIMIVQFAFNGIRAGVLALIIKALISMAKQCPHNIIAYFIIGATFFAVVLFDVSILIIIISSAIMGYISSQLTLKESKKL